MPRALSLKKVQVASSKNQKSITHFFKSGGSDNKDLQNELESQEKQKSSKRRAISPIILNIHQPAEKCNILEKLDNKIDAHERTPKKFKNVQLCSVQSKFQEKTYHKENAVIQNTVAKCKHNSHSSPEQKNNRSPLTPVLDENVCENNVTNGISNIYSDVITSGGSGHEDTNINLNICDGYSPYNLKRKVDMPDMCFSKQPEHLSIVVKKSPEKTITDLPPKLSSTLKDSDITYDDVDDLFEDNWCEADSQVCKEDLDLSILQRCEVLSVKCLPSKVELRLKNSSNMIGTCCLEGIWCNTAISSGDTVSILADCNSSGDFSVNNTSGLIVLRPDHLMSSTSVVAGVFCKRKALLQERWRGIDSANTAMTIGILIHELVQKAITQQIMSKEQLHSEAQTIIKNSIQMLYDAGLTDTETLLNIKPYIQPLADFMNTYISRSGSKTVPNIKWGIDKVLDIEENVCCPQLGLKGKIDATLQIKNHDRKESQNEIVPLELKSGKASESAEHRGQLVLYGMMMSALQNGNPAKDVQKGLLLYLKDRVNVKEVSCGYPERRDLIMLRNQLVQYIADGPSETDPEQLTDIEDASQLLQMKLPEPVHHPTACSKCPYLTLCSLHLWHTNNTAVSESHPLVNLREQALSHLSAEHIKYFQHWAALLKMEEKGQSKAFPLRSLWTDSAEKREKRGTCAANLKLILVKEADGRYQHVFEGLKKPANHERSNKATKGPQEGEFSIVSIDNRPWLAAGVISLIKDKQYHIILERDLSKRYKSDTSFHIDLYESYATTVQNLTNLGVLIEDSDRSERLRKLIIDKEPPEFEKKLPREVGRLGAKLMRSLNIEQQRAVLRTLATKDYALLQGLPGTGKTQTICVLIQMLVALKQRVLVTAHTHSAVDTVLSRLPSSLQVMRLGSASRVAASLEARTEQRLTAKCESPAQLEHLYNSMEVVGVTCLGAAHAMLARTTFDVCIVDEATQVLQCTVLRPLFAAKRFLLVGDPDQLPPVVRSRAASRLGMEESLFHRLCTAEATSSLHMQYRMNQRLVDVANKVAYSSRLKCANEAVAKAKLNIDVTKLSKLCDNQSTWLLNACSPEEQYAATFLNMCTEEAESNSDDNNKTCTNSDEACVVLALVEALTKAGVQSSEIGVIAPFRDQVALLRRSMSNFGAEVSTVDQFQGRDKSVIIYSCTRRDNIPDKRVKEGEILNDQRRLAVSVTRAKHKLVVVGNYEALQRYKPLQQLIEACVKLPLSTDVVKSIINKYSALVT